MSPIPCGSLHGDSNPSQSPADDTSLGKGKLTYSSGHLGNEQALRRSLIRLTRGEGVYMTYTGWAELNIPSFPLNQPQSLYYIGVDEPRRSHYQLSGKDNTILVQGCVDSQPSFPFSYLSNYYWLTRS
jgi:hypothetical protein